MNTATARKQEARRIYAFCGVAAIILVGVLMWLGVHGRSGPSCHTWADGSRTCGYAR